MNDFLAQARERLPFILAVAATTLWVAVAVIFVRSFGGMDALKVMAPADLAILVAAFGGPLAALWMFMAVLEQRRALVHFSRRVSEMAAQNRQGLQQAESQTRTLLQLQNQAARAQAVETRRFALQDMAASTAVLAERLGVIKRDAAPVAWARYGAGDVNVFVQAFLNVAVSHPDISERMADAVVRDPIASAALATFVRRYERLVAASADDKMAAEILDDGALGRGYRLFKMADEVAARMLAPPPASHEAVPTQSEAPPSQMTNTERAKPRGDAVAATDPALVSSAMDLFERLDAAAPKS